MNESPEVIAARIGVGVQITRVVHDLNEVQIFASVDAMVRTVEIRLSREVIEEIEDPAMFGEVAMAFIKSAIEWDASEAAAHPLN